MKPRDRKLAILRQLGLEAEPITIAELAGKLELDLTDRTVRRWLNELIKEGLVLKSGRTKSARYIAVGGSAPRQSVIESTVKEMSSCFSSVSLKAIEQINRPLFEREYVSYRPEWLEVYSPNETSYLPVALKEQLHKAGRRASEQDPAGTYAHQVFNRLLIDLSYNSSRLEGNTYSLLETERLLLVGEKAEGKLDEESVMILNHKEAIKYLVDQAPRLEISRNSICTVHYLLADGLVEAKYAGKVRDYPVRIGGSVYIPFEDNKRLEQQLELISAKGALITDPFEQSLFLLAHLSYLQAFVDVNKRTARLVANISLVKANLVPLAFKDVEVMDYMSAMIVLYELQDMRPLIDLYVYSYLRTCAAYDATVKAIGFDEVRVRYRAKRRAIIHDVILKRLVGDKLQLFIESQAEQAIPAADRASFIDDVHEDLVQMDESRLVGLGVTPDELATWFHLRKNAKSSG